MRSASTCSGSRRPMSTGLPQPPWARSPPTAATASPTWTSASASPTTCRSLRCSMPGHAPSSTSSMRCTLPTWSILVAGRCPWRHIWPSTVLDPQANAKVKAPMSTSRLTGSDCRWPPGRSHSLGGHRRWSWLVVLPPAAEMLAVLVDGVPVGLLGPGRLGHRLPLVRMVGEHAQPVGFQHVGVIDEGAAGGVVGERRAGWLLAVAVAVALVALLLRVRVGLEAGRDGEVATQHRPAGGMLIDQVPAGGVGIAGEVAGDRVEQDAALVGGVAVVVAVGAPKVALGGGAGDDRSGTHRMLPPGWGDGWVRRRAGSPPASAARADGLGGGGRSARRVGLVAGPVGRLLPVDPGHGGLQQVVVVAAGGLGEEAV